ncbi:MAG: amidohydrolase [Gammaproteobacteria bacterium]|nr:MAG: amidohydrolase [Gammaproteobacteria bacterium]
MFAVLFMPLVGLGQSELTDEKKAILNSLDMHSEDYGAMAHKIWGLAELGFLENESLKLLTAPLVEAGMDVQIDVAGMPTAFIAEYGSGEPVIAFLAEYDALPGMSQGAVPYRESLPGGGSGHACGHHLFGSASVAATVAIKKWMESSGVKGTIRLYGTPAEEGGGAKVFMVRDGLFDDVDAVLTWHPGDRNVSSPVSTLSAMGGVYTFTGIPAHAAAGPERGRSALDGVEAMNHMVNMMREHIPMESRIHYTVKYGGGAPNIVPATASVAYIIRHPDMPTVKDLLRRVMLAAEGAAMGTETTVSMEVETGYFNVMANSTLSKLVHDNLSLVGGVSYTEEEQMFATQIMESYDPRGMTPESAAEITPYNPNPPIVSASTDVGDISWVVPTTSMRAATWVPGTVAHSWQAVAAGGMSIGRKGMMVAAKSLALSAVDLFRNPETIEVAKKELLAKRGDGFKYEPLIGDIEPPLTFRESY